ncbi:MAG TPA: hypothetical protein VEG27_10595 [Usitatibacter sp.]|nr:hypothetical protein [Usitatibacter sp.]
MRAEAFPAVRTTSDARLLSLAIPLLIITFSIAGSLWIDRHGAAAGGVFAAAHDAPIVSGR